MENESSVVCVCGVTNLLKVSYCLIISSLLLYQLQVNIIQPISFSFLICTPFLQLYAWFYVMGGGEKSTEDVSLLVIASTHHRPLLLDAIKNLLHLLQKELLVLLRAHGTTEGEKRRYRVHAE